jgi:hypothetical protein
MRPKAVKEVETKREGRREGRKESNKVHSSPSILPP